MKKKTKKLIEATGAKTGSNLGTKKATKKRTRFQVALPSMTAEASERGDSLSRRDLAGSIERTDRFVNIDNGLVPFRNSNTIYGPNKSSVDIRDAVILCQKCYYNFALFRNTIDLMTEFSIDQIRFKKASKQSRDFFEALFKKINMWDLQDKFYREYFRSGNVFIYRFDAEVKPGDVRKISQSMAADMNKTAKIKKSNLVGDPVLDQNQPLGQPVKDDGNPLNGNPPLKLEVEPMMMPARYIILNPADINMLGTANFSYGIYYKVLTEYEVSKLRNLQSQEDIEVFNTLPKFTQDQIRAGVRSVYIPLDTKKVRIIFYKKQDYEPFAVPMGYPVLEDINAKIEMRRIDMAISRTMQQIILLVTAGNEPDKGGINQKNLDTLKQLFTNQSVGRVLIADYTTKAEFVIPNIHELLDPRKYEVIDRDINIGLNNVFLGGEKFANQQKKIEVFIKRLEQAKEAFIQHFLWPEMKRIAKSLNFKNCPEPYFDNNQFRDEVSDAKIYAHLADIGLLTPEQTIKAIQDSELPEPEDLEDAQEKYKEARDKGYYQPLIGGKPQPGQEGGIAGNGGRPEGSTGPKGSKKVGPMGSGTAKASVEEPMKFSLVNLKDNMILAQDVEKEITSYLKKKYKIKKLNEAQANVVVETATTILANEEPKNWVSSVKAYCENPIDQNQSRVNKVLAVAAEHLVDNYVAGLLYASRKQ